jgi:hypothetical protein
MEEFDAPPTIEELRKAFDALFCGKAPGSDAIPAKIVKAGKENSLLGHLHELLLQCWDEGTLPKDMWDVKIVTLYKNKSDRSDCNNYRRISLLSTVARHSQGLSLTTSNSSLTEFTQSLSADFERKGQQLTWFSPSDSFRRNYANRDAHCTSPSLT